MFLMLPPFAEHVVVSKLQGEFVVDEACRRTVALAALKACHGDIIALLCDACDGYDEVEEEVVQVVCFVEAEDKFFFRILKIMVSILVVGIGQLYYLDTDDFSVYHKFCFLRVACSRRDIDNHLAHRAKRWCNLPPSAAFRMQK